MEVLLDERKVDGRSPNCAERLLRLTEGLPTAWKVDGRFSGRTES